VNEGIFGRQQCEQVDSLVCGQNSILNHDQIALLKTIICVVFCSCVQVFSCVEKKREIDLELRSEGYTFTGIDLKKTNSFLMI